MFLACLAVLVYVVGSVNVQVDVGQGADVPGCGLPGSAPPCASIRGGIASASTLGSLDEPATVRVQPGTYEADCSVDGTVLNESISIVGVAGLDGSRPLIDCRGEGRVFKFQPTAADATLLLQSLHLAPRERTH